LARLASNRRRLAAAMRPGMLRRARPGRVAVLATSALALSATAEDGDDVTRPRSAAIDGGSDRIAHQTSDESAETWAVVLLGEAGMGCPCEGHHGESC
jgi:hypothetical protein